MSIDNHRAIGHGKQRHVDPAKLVRDRFSPQQDQLGRLRQLFSDVEPVE